MDAFPFTKYGMLEATVTDVSDDAVHDEALGWVFTTRARLTSPFLRVDGKNVRMAPGMTISLEIKTGRRRVIEYFLSPILRHGTESIRER